ncbi:diguanylate cyclase (GGDEF)-like protein/PAS domain S-box-containing protein [Pararhizobium capsulatum DSM 1112]|uniref:Diguanylate cyclase (GGDEF)-like protein/PAS domain S-box-containing protein n=1 Tax=Pararhizobium capsulatum DSM 1112 TaxID=1121113 RepID=A0ABU0BQG0_9HYPH|nr:bifunctional diguanylate cyclase/phosphodiesterase [Pararhizobium capsulatum]MDQ0320470.1 diguanylate cyclase (GGDEF)-like protein/PAS domain S-box-containing protein [Pararhizobium capsulatum DSM 1112]
MANFQNGQDVTTSDTRSAKRLADTAASDGFPAQALLDDAPAGFCLFDGNGKLHYANAMLERLLPGSRRGVSINELVSAESVGSLRRALATLDETGAGVSHCELRSSAAGGTHRWLQASLSVSDLDNGRQYTMQVQPIDGAMQKIAILEASETRWKHALDSAHQGVWDHDFKANDLFYSATWKKIRGMAADATVDGELETWIESVHPDDRAWVLECIRRQDEGEVEFNTFEYRERHADGHYVWIESRGASIQWGEDGRPTRVIGTDTDISARKKDAARLQEISRRLRLALDISKIGVFEANLDRGTVVRDAELIRLYGYDPETTDPGRAMFEELLHPDDYDEAMRIVQEGTASGEPFMNAFRIIRPDGETRHIRSRSIVFIDGEGERKLVGANWDVTEDINLRDELDHARRLAEARNDELEAAKARIEYNALHDHLTKLPNRRYLDQKLDDWMAGRVRYCAILHIDLDRFKQINDTLGHQAGDAMLVHTAQVLSSAIDTGDFVARIGGDEFVILCAPRTSPDDIVPMANGVIDLLRRPVPYQGYLCRFGASAGIAWVGDDGQDARLSLMNADIALYRAKSLGRNRSEFFTKHLQTQIQHAKRTADDIIRGIEDGEFIPFYQPQFNARTLNITGVETLVRWQHPRLGLLAPDHFLKIAEDIDALSTIDRAIASQALRDFASWDAADLPVARLSLNVSSRRLREPDLVESLKALDFPPGRLSFELLESIFLDELEDGVSETIAALKALGIEIEIDDFGTGHASIIGLLKLSPARLKIDRALIKPLTDVPEQRKLVGSIIDIGHSLNVEVVAEGVETLAHAVILQDLGCDILQGYAFARPMAREDFEVFARACKWPQETKSFSPKTTAIKGSV